MGHFGISTLGVVLVVVSGCASSSGARTYEARSPQSQQAATSVTTTTSATPGSPPRTQDSPSSSSMMLTSGNVTSPSPATASSSTSPATHDVTARWTDEQIVAALAAAQGSEDELRTVRDKSKSARVDRLASQALMEQRELTNGQASLSRRIPAQQSEMSARLAEARRALSDAIASNAPTGFDHGFVDAEITYCHALLRAIDNDMAPSARSADLKAYLQNLRAKTANRLLQAQEIESQIK